MGDLLAFHPRKPALAERREPSAAPAEIILFPGIRYERMEEPLQPAKRAPRSRRREKPKKEKAS